MIEVYAAEYDPLPIRTYQPTNEIVPKFQFLDKVTVSEFCEGTHTNEGSGATHIARKVIELIENEQPERVLAIIGRTRLHIGVIEEDYEYSDYDSQPSGQRYLRETSRHTVYVLSDGFGKSFKSLPDYMKKV